MGLTAVSESGSGLASTDASISPDMTFCSGKTPIRRSHKTGGVPPRRAADGELRRGRPGKCSTVLARDRPSPSRVERARPFGSANPSAPETSEPRGIRSDSPAPNKPHVSKAKPRDKGRKRRCRGPGHVAKPWVRAPYVDGHSVVCRQALCALCCWSRGILLWTVEWASRAVEGRRDHLRGLSLSARRGGIPPVVILKKGRPRPPMLVHVGGGHAGIGDVRLQSPWSG